MKTANIFKNGNSQVVRLPKEYQLKGEEVYIKRIGASIILLPLDDPWRALEDSLDRFSDDFMTERVRPPLKDRAI